MAHNNRNTNDLPHHLYKFIDRKDNDTFKYGISSDPIEEDGLSRRIKVQLRLLNVIDGWKRFIAKILLKEIKDRPTAKKIEKEYIDKYEAKNGRRPRGNL